MARSDIRPHDVLVCGLGRFGSATAELGRLGHEVLALDRDPHLVQEWAGRMTHVVEADSTSPRSSVAAATSGSPWCRSAPRSSPSVLTAVNLVDLGVKQIWAKALTPAHGKILARIGVHHVVYPEKDAGARVAHLVPASSWTTSSSTTGSRSSRCARRRRPRASPWPSRGSARSTG